jgi:hypothetical protein
MVAISHKHGFVFLKTRKTAGTSVEMVLEQYCRPPGAVITEKTRAIQTKEGIIGRRLTKRSKLMRYLPITDWYNHMKALEVAKALGEQRWSTYSKITTIRNPFDLAVSQYHWELEKKRIPEAEDFAETRERFNAMVRQKNFDCDKNVTHIGDVFVVDHVVRYENLEEDLRAVIRSIVGASEDPQMPFSKKTSHKRKRSVAEYFDDESIDAIRRSSEWAFMRFGYPDKPI